MKRRRPQVAVLAAASAASLALGCSSGPLAELSGNNPESLDASPVTDLEADGTTEDAAVANGYPPAAPSWPSGGAAASENTRQVELDLPPVEVVETDVFQPEAPGEVVMNLPITNDPAMNDVITSWATVRRNRYAAAATAALEVAEAARAGAEAAAAASDAAAAASSVPSSEAAPTTAAPATTQPPAPALPPIPMPTLKVDQVAAHEIAVPNTVRLSTREEIDGGNTSYLSLVRLPNGHIVFGSALVTPQKRQEFIELVRSQVVEPAADGEAANGDGTAWSTAAWPSVVSGSILQDVQLGEDGSLIASVPASLLAQPDAGDQVVIVDPEQAKPFLSPSARWLIDLGRPTAAAARPDCTSIECVALTYDDGPSENTADLLGVLRHSRTPATFYMIGVQVEKYPQIAVDVATAGHQIGNHTWSHARLGALNVGAQRVEVDSTQKIIEDVTGVSPQTLRPPFGVYNDDTRQLGFGVSLWSVDTQDWQVRDPLAVLERVVVDTGPGEVVLMHDLYATAGQVAAVAIAALRSEGYRLVTTDQLFGPTAPGFLYYDNTHVEPLE